MLDKRTKKKLKTEILIKYFIQKAGNDNKDLSKEISNLVTRLNIQNLNDLNLRKI